MNLEKLVNKKQVVAVICSQWGDTGKGKIVDYFSDWADVIARGTGGNNAGHTVVVKDEQRILHLLPSGIIHDSDGKINILGNGMAIDPKALCSELDELDRDGVSYDNLMISKDAHVILPYHIMEDRLKHQSQEKGGIGSTGRGIGPCYADKVSRRGIRIEDLFDKDRLARKIRKASEFYASQEKDVDEIVSCLNPFIERLKPFVRNTVAEIHGLYKQGKKILLEGAQGLLLSIEHGTDPFVTSSDCSLNGTVSGVGLPATVVDLPLSAVKFPFMTRVGAGPFPTELGGSDSEKYCAAGIEHNAVYELEQHAIPFTEKEGKIFYAHNHPNILDLMNSQDLFTQGIGIRLAAGEYGATTKRPRRIGWTDAVAAKYAVGINGGLMILTKADCLSGAERFRICYEYKNGDSSTTDFSRDEGFLRRVSPSCITYKGYDDISGVKEYKGLPLSLQKAIGDFEKFTGGKAVIISTGAERGSTIVR